MQLYSLTLATRRLLSQHGSDAFFKGLQLVFDHCSDRQWIDIT